MTRRFIFGLAAVLAVAACNDQPDPTGSSDQTELASTSGTTRVNVVLKAAATPSNHTELSKHGTIYDEIAQINTVLMRVKGDKIAAIRALPFVAGVSMDAVRDVGPIPAIEAGVEDFAAGTNVWNLDAINVTEKGSTVRQVTETGDNVYVAILDTGLLPSWRSYFPEDRIAPQYAKSFGGGGAANNGAVSEQPNKWEQDVNSHGTHVASIVLGYQYHSAASGPLKIAGVAPKATVIPVKVLNQNGSGWSSTIAQGVTYIAGLVDPKTGELDGKRVVINMSLGGSQLDMVEELALNMALDNNIVVVASAGNNGPEGAMGYPGAYGRVISVAAAGWIGEWDDPAEPLAPNPECSVLGPDDAFMPSRFWRQCDVPEGYDESNYYITDFSAEESGAGATGPQDLDVAAPGSWVVGPWQEQQGKISYFFIGGTSQASPHVAGIVALMLEQNRYLPASEVEGKLEDAAEALNYRDQQVRPGNGARPFDLAPVPDWGSDGEAENRAGHGFITADAALGS